MPQTLTATKTSGFAAFDSKSPLRSFEFERRKTQPKDVRIEILYCGVCHSDLHMARNEWEGFPTAYPVVPGHEIIGRVIEAGSQVRNFRAGDLAAVGCMVDSCRRCPNCAEGLEQYCDNELVLTYNSPDKHLPGQMTYGGYSNQIVVDEHFVLKVSKKLEGDLAAAAPLLCAGITTYSPLKQWGAATGKKVGIVGLGGLGHMGVKFSHAFGARTVLFTTSPGKVADGKRLGADEVVISRNADAMAAHANSFDFILDTVAASHDLDAYLQLLKRDGTLCLVGAPEHPHPSPQVMGLIFKRRRIAGSAIGGVKETQEMLDFCAAKNIVCDVEVIPMQQINQAYERLVRSDVKYRFVIDMASLNGSMQES